MNLFRRTSPPGEGGTGLAHDYQPYRLVGAMEEQGLRHGDTARVNIKHVRVGALVGTALLPDGLFFCEIGPLEVNKVVGIGDGAELPDEVVLKGLRKLELGYYDIKDALLTSNGAVQLTIDERTQVVAAEPVT